MEDEILKGYLNLGITCVIDATNPRPPLYINIEYNEGLKQMKKINQEFANSILCKMVCECANIDYGRIKKKILEVNKF